MFGYTIDELIDLYNKEDIETRGSLNDFIKKINNPTDPKKAKGDTKKDTKVDPKSTVSSSVSGSLEQPEDDRYIKFKSGTIVYEDDYLKNFAGTENYPKTFDEYAKAFGAKPQTFQNEAVKITTEKFDYDVSSPIDKDYYNLESDEAAQLLDLKFAGSGIYRASDVEPITAARERGVVSNSLTKLIIEDPETGEINESDTIVFNTTDEDVIKENNKIIKDFTEKNKNILDSRSYQIKQAKIAAKYYDTQENIIKPELNKRLETDKQKYLINPGLFDSYTESSYEYTKEGGRRFIKTISPYSEEIEAQYNLIKSSNKSISDNKASELAKQQVRQDLFNQARNEAIREINKELIENSSNDKEAQAFLYQGSYSAKERQDKKVQDADESINIATEQAKIYDSIIEKYSTSIPSELDIEKDLNELGLEYKSGNRNVKLENGDVIDENVYNILKASTENVNSEFRLARDAYAKKIEALGDIRDLNLALDAASKNYDLHEKYLANVGVGFLDIGFGIGYLGSKLLTIAAPRDGSVNKFLDESAVEYSKYSQQVRNSYVRDVSLEESFNSASDFGKFWVQEISNQIPILLTMAASGGSASIVIGASSMGGKMIDMQYEMATGKAEYSGAEFWLKSFGYGLAEGVFSELTTVPILRRAKANWKLKGGNDLLDNSTREYVKSKGEMILLDSLLEPAGEIPTQIAQNLLDGVDTLENVDHAGASGFGMSLIMSGIPFLKGAYTSKFSTYNDYENVRKLQNEIKELSIKYNEIGDKRFTPAKLLAKNIKSKQLQVQEAILKTENIINNNLRASHAKEVISLNKDLANLQNQAKELQQDKTLDNKTKQKLLNDLKVEFDVKNKIKQYSLSEENMQKYAPEFALLQESDPNRYNNLVEQAKFNLKGKYTPELAKKEAYELYLKEEIISRAKTAGKVKGANLEIIETAEEAAEKYKDILDEKQLSLVKSGKIDGFKNSSGVQVVIVETAVENQVKEIGTHEVGHYVTDKLFEGNEKAYAPIAKDLMRVLYKVDKKLHNRVIKLAEPDANGNPLAHEVIARFTEIVAEGKADYVETKKIKGLAGLFGVLTQTQFSNEYDFNFKGETDIYNFVVGLGKKIASGEVDLVSQAREGVLIQEYIEKAEREGIAEPETEDKKSLSDLRQQRDELDMFDFDDPNEFDSALANIERKIKIAEKKEKEAKTKPAVEKPKSSVNEKQIGDRFKEMVPQGTTNAEYQANIAPKVIRDIEDKRTLFPLVKKIAAGYGIVADNVYGKSFDDFYDAVIGVQMKKNIMNFKPESNDDLGGYIIGSQAGIRNRIKEALAKFKKEEAKASEDIGQARDLAAEETTTSTKDTRKKYTSISNSNVVPNFTITAIKDKLTNIISNLKSKITDKAGDNAASTPLIKEIRKNVGKVVGDKEAIPKLIRQRMGAFTKDRDTYKSFLIKNKRAILENMTTTWLSTAVPIAVEKSVGGSYTGNFEIVNIAGVESKYEIFNPKYVPYSEWKDAKIDREGGAKRGITSGNELIRRAPVSKVSDQEFVDALIFKGNNKKTQTKFESLSKALAEELSFEIISKELKNPNSEISLAFEANQQALGVMIQDNIAQEFSRQAERGLVKFSMSNNVGPRVTDFLSVEGANSVNAKKLAKAAGFTKTAYENFIQRVGVNTINRLKTITDKEIALQEIDLDYLESIEDYEKAYSGIKFSISKREAYKNRLTKKRPNLDKNQIESSVQSVFDFAKNPNIQDKKKSKLEKLAFHYMANGFVILPEDGYKVIEAEKIATAKKIDPFSFKNPNELIEKYAGQVKKARTNPDTVKEFTNKKELPNGVVTYDVQDSKNGQLAVREVIDTNWGEKSNPWCLAARNNRVGQTYEEFFEKEEADLHAAELKSIGYEVEVGFIESEGRYEVYGDMIAAPNSGLELQDAFTLWQDYNKQGNGFKISFKDGKLLSFRDGNKKQWWDRMDKPSNDLVYEVKEKGISVDGQKTEITYNVDANSGSRSVANSIVGDKKSGNYTITENTIDRSRDGDFRQQVVREFKNDRIVNRKSTKTSIKDGFIDIYTPMFFHLGSEDDIKIKYEDKKADSVLKNVTYEYLEIPYSPEVGSKTIFPKVPKGRTFIKKGDLGFDYDSDIKVFKDVTILSETNNENDSYKTLTIDGVDVLVGPKEIDLSRYVKARESGNIDTGIKFSKSISGKLNSAIFRVFYEDFANKAMLPNAAGKADRNKRIQAYDLFNEEFKRLLEKANESDMVGNILLKALEELENQYITKEQYQNILDNARKQYIPIFERKDFETKSFERLLFELKGDIDELILPQVRSVGVEESMFTLKDRLKGLKKDSKEAFDILKSYIENESRSIRTFSYLGISTNNKFNLRLQEIGIKLEDYGIIVEEEYQKYRVYYISDEGVKTYITGYKTIEETKNKLNKDSFRKIINEEASSARDYTYSLLEYYTNKIKNAKDSDKKAIKDKAFAHFQVLSLDQTGVLRKVSKAGLIVLDKNGNPINNKKQKKLKRKTRTILEHSVTINDITKEIKNTIYSNNQDLKPLKDLLEQAYVNVVTNKQDDMLTKAGLKQKGGARRVFQTNFKKSIDRLNKQGRVYGYGVVYGESIDEQQQAINNTTKPSYTQNPKGISVWDFDDTLARTKSNVLYTMPDGTKGKLDAAEFAARSESLADIGAEFDFSEFSKVMKGEKGPMFDKAIARNKKFGNENVYILTARPPDSKFAIHKFLKGIGLDIKLDNIVGLADGNPQAKANWMIGKVAEGYNDFYFADDHLGNVKAVKEVLDTFDVKGKVQQAKIKFSASLDKNFNDIIQRNKGVLSEKEYSKVAASRLGARKGRFKVWMPSSLDDFKGLTMYAFSGKGKQGEADQKFFQDALITPYFRGVKAIYQKKQALKDDFKKLNKMYKPVLKKLGKLIPNFEYTHDQAIRVYLWNKAGYEIPGLDIKDKNRLVDFISKDKELLQYTQMLQRIAKRKKWTKPSAHWDAETILSDLNNITEKVGRKEYLAEFIENVDIVFSEKNLNKVEALYGRSHREALEDIMYRMKNGTNRPSGNNKNVNRFNNWINNSIGAIMFFNRRSAVLQTLSTANFINWSDNNMLKAGLAFANQPQFWKDFTMIFNSAKLKQRRSGLRSDVNEAEIASAVKGSKNKALAALSYLLKIGFTPTQMVDSFAIASGGASFYRNRLNTYISKVNPDGEKIYTQKQAEQKAFDDFSVIAEETQQSGDPALISSDQASALGRLILAFQNTPIQLNRSIKKAALDIKNRRRAPGLTMIQSDFSNLSKIIYYGAIQNLIFSALQNALFALIPGFEDEDDELTEEEQLEKYGKVVSTKQGRIINGISDTILKGGFGVPGAFISTIKNVYLEKKKQEEKDFMADNAYVILQAANLAPSVGSKLRKIYSGMQTEKFEKDVIEARGWDVTIDGKFNLSPKYRVLGAYVEGSTNFPLERMTSEVESLTEALDARNSAWQRVALALGWRTWDVGAKNEEHELIKAEGKAKRKKEGIEKAKVSRKNINDMKKAYEKSLKQVSYKEARIKTLVENFKGEKLSSLTKDVEDIILKEYEKQDSIKDIMFEKGYKLEKNKFVKIK